MLQTGVAIVTGLGLQYHPNVL